MDHRDTTLVVMTLVLALVGCGGGSDSPTTPAAPPPTAIAITGVSPTSGSTVVVPEQYPYIVPGGVVLPPQSSQISVSLSIRSVPEVPWARLNVYLLTGGQGPEYCGQNLPDSPAWGSVPAGWTTAYTVTGFQVYHLPCEVTGILAVLHTRNDGLLTPPTAAETIASATVPVSFLIRR